MKVFLNTAMQYSCYTCIMYLHTTHLTWKSEEELHHHLSLSYSLSHLPHWALARGLCQQCLRVWGGAAGRKHSYQGLIFLPHGDWKKNGGTCWRQDILLYTYWWHLLLPLSLSENQPQKRAWLSVPHLPHFFWPQTHIALRNSCIHSSAWCTRLSWGLVQEWCGPTVRGWWGGAGSSAQPGWDKSGHGQSPLLLLWGWNAADLTQYI